MIILTVIFKMFSLATYMHNLKHRYQDTSVFLLSMAIIILLYIAIVCVPLVCSYIHALGMYIATVVYVYIHYISEQLTAISDGTWGNNEEKYDKKVRCI